MNYPALEIDRRSFVKIIAMTGGGFALGLFSKVPEALAAPADTATAAAAVTQVPEAAFANMFVRIAPNGIITLIAKNPDIGQGVKTTLPMMLAEELEVDFKSVVIEQAGPNPAMGNQMIGGSQSTGGNYMLMRRTGAVAREMLIAAAAATWNVPATECRAENGKVIHTSGKSLDYGKLAARAATMPVPDPATIKLKDPKNFKIIGTSIPHVDTPKIVTGRPLFGLDQSVPGMLHATYVKCPIINGKAVGANLDAVKKLPGIKDAFILPGGNDPRGLRSGVAIVGEHTWAVLSARKQLNVKWDEGPAVTESWDGYVAKAEEISKRSGDKIVKTVGDVEAGLKSAAKVITANYVYPFVAHNVMEPQNCLAWPKDGKLEIWVPTQNPAGAQQSAASASRIKREDITVHIVRAGGGFGRRINTNYVAEAAAIAVKVNAPVKLMWTREDEIACDEYRAAGFHFLRGGLGADGKIVAWHDRFVGFGVGNSGRFGEFADVPGNGFPGSGKIPNYQTESSPMGTTVPMGSWRAPGVNTYSWVVQSFIDELAYAAGKDPLQFRLSLDGNRDLETVAKLAGWGKKLPKGSGMGISAGGSSAQVAEVTVAKNGTLKVQKITIVLGAGLLINPSGAESQAQGGVLDSLSATLYGSINLINGKIQESNFDNCPLLRISEAPDVEVHFNTPGPNSGPNGLGESAVPATAAAVCNAIFAATGKRIRKLPISKNDLSWS